MGSLNQGTTAAAFTFLQSGTSAVPRTAQSKMRDIVSVQDFNVVPNDATKRATNNTALRALVSDVAYGGDATFQFRGIVFFPVGNTWNFSDVIPLRDGIELDLGMGTVDFTAVYNANFDSCGFFYFMRDCAVRNGTININFDGSAGVNAGSALKIGNRGTESIYFNPSYDSTFALPSGNCRVENLRIISNNPAVAMVGMWGGLENITFDHIYLDGQNLAYNGLDYEFGWWNSTVPVQNRQSSHAHNLIFRDIVGVNLQSAGTGDVIDLRGAWNVHIEQIVALNTNSIISIGTGEAANYNPGAPYIGGVKRTCHISNIEGYGILKTAISISGITPWTGYLSPLATQNQTDVEIKTTDLLDVVIDTFAITSVAGGGQGIQCSGDFVTLKNGRLTGFSNAIYDAGCHTLAIDNVHGLDSTFGSGLSCTAVSVYPLMWTDKTISVKNSTFAGNPTGISLDGCVNGIIENCNFGYNRQATGSFQITGGTAGAGNQLTSLKVNGVEILTGPGTPVLWAVSNANTAVLIAAAINAYTATSGYTATSVGDGTVGICAALGTGTTPNGYVVLPTVGGNVTVGTIKDISGGKIETVQANSVYAAASAATSNLTVRNCNTLKATGIAYRNLTATGSTKFALENNYGQTDFSGVWQASGSYLGVVTGGTTDPGSTVYYRQRGNKVDITFTSFTAISNAVTKTITGNLPVNMYPTGNSYFMCLSRDNGGAYVASSGFMDTTGVLNLFAGPNDNAWTAGGTFGVRNCSFSYIVP